MTPKQEAFARMVAEGKDSLSDCYRATYKTGNMAPATVRNEASKLMARPDITAMVSGLKAKKAAAVVACGASDADFVMQRLRQMAEDALPTDSVRLRAVELLGKTCGLFRDVVETQATRAPDEVKAELEELLAKVAERTDPNKSEPADDAPVDMPRTAADDDADMDDHPIVH